MTINLLCKAKSRTKQSLEQRGLYLYKKKYRITMKNKMNENSFISHFSSSIIGNGKKVCGHKIFLQSLFRARQLQKKNHVTCLQLDQNEESKSFFDFLIRIGFSLQRIQEFVKSGKKSYLREQDYNKYIELESVRLNVKSTTNLKNSEIDTTVEKESSSKKKTKFDKERSRKVKTSNVLKSEKENVLVQDKIFQSTNKKFLDNSICNIKPILEIRKVRKGRMTYRVPLITQLERQQGRAIAWIIKSACNTKAKKERKENHFSILSSVRNTYKQSKSFEQEKKNSRSIETCLAQELIDAFNRKGQSFEKKKESQKIALQNRAYTHYRWW